MRIQLHTTKQGCKDQNYTTESEIDLLVRHWRLCMHKKKVSRQLREFGLVYESKLLCHMAHGTDKQTGYKEVTRQILNISEWLDFGLYNLVWWLD